MRIICDPEKLNRTGEYNDVNNTNSLYMDV